MALVRFALKNPYLILVSVVATAALGLIAYFRLPKDLLPLFKTPAVQILTLYPGMPAEVVEMKHHLAFIRAHKDVLRLKLNAAEDTSWVRLNHLSARDGLALRNRLAMRMDIVIANSIPRSGAMRMNPSVR